LSAGKENRYFTLQEKARSRVPVGGCRFYALLSPTADEEEAKKALEEVREEFPGATHHVYAYRLLLGREIRERSSDDREPAGSAGKPVLEVLRKENLINAQLVAVRYFGGVKLGIGGLIRAYRLCADEGIKAAELVPVHASITYKASVPYEILGDTMKLITSQNGEVIDVAYGDRVLVSFRLSPGAAESFPAMFQDYTRGAGILTES